MLISLIEDYPKPVPRCTRNAILDPEGFRCDTMVLGALRKNTVSIQLQPPPAPPFTGMSFCHLSKQILEMSDAVVRRVLSAYGGQKSVF